MHKVEKHRDFVKWAKLVDWDGNETTVAVYRGDRGGHRWFSHHTYNECTDGLEHISKVLDAFGRELPFPSEYVKVGNSFVPEERASSPKYF